jgi:DNA adenine methylase
LNLFPEYGIAKPFLKWAGGKTQLIQAIEAALPVRLLSEKNITYVEPFIGSGAILFWIIRNFPNIKNVIINDVNADLINAYRNIKANPDNLIRELQVLQSKYQSCKTEAEKQEFYYNIRSLFNSRNHDDIIGTSYLIFLNRTCFNGLYRVNSKNAFNVPFGKYANPKICDKDNIEAVSFFLQNVTILNGDFEETKNHFSGKSFYYFDPPYRPLSHTSSFNSYSFETFDDKEQIRLANFCKFLNKDGHHWLLSNSDPQNINTTDSFFDDLYAEFFITRVNAKRMINSDSSKRGEIKELLISNYAMNNFSAK